MRRLLYAIVVLMVLAAGWQVWSLHRTWHYLETESLAQSYGATPDKAKVTVIAFVDYASRPSKDVNGIVMSAVLENPDTRIIFHPIISQTKTGLRATSVALAAAMQGKFIPMHEELMRSEGSFSDDDIRAMATRIKADPDKLLKDAGSKEMLAKLYRELAAEQKIGLNMSPLFYFNRKTLYGPDSLDTLHDDFVAEIKKARQ